MISRGYEIQNRLSDLIISDSY